MEAVFFFVFFYPLFMAIFWMMGSAIFFVRREKRARRPPRLKAYPKIAILVPCHNEELIIRDAIEQLSENEYPNFEIIAINDGSTDRTGEILAEIASGHPKLRVVTLTHNYGKAMALRAGTLVSSAEFLMCIDADALLAKDALFWMMEHFLNGPRVGAVTGNPRVLNRTSLLARIQIGEFSAIIGMVKRSQRNLGRLFTVSGVNACFRRAALYDVGFWSSSTVTEDIDISWKLQLKHWDIRYEPRALTWILVPEKIGALWRQRLRWAQGGVEAAIRYFRDMSRWRSRRMWSVYAEYWVGVLWCYAFLLTVACWAGTRLWPEWPVAMRVSTLIPGWTGVILAVTCLAQFSVGLYIDSVYERRGLLRYLFWAIWYPAIYWLISAFTTVVAVPKGAWQYRRTRYAVWKSPARRLRDLLVWMRPRGRDRGHVFAEHPLVVHSRRLAELLVTVVFWGLWVYFVTPLVSLLLWLAGIYLFVDRMISMGGYRAFADQLVHYAAAVFVMWFLLTAWVLWNQTRYGRNERRTVRPPHVSEAKMAKAMGLEPETVVSLRVKKKIALHFESEARPCIEHAS
ncbi:N-glycosyltransferase [Sulfurifustis variabilis]|uniref:Poly-beta-1,6-N-acetyl-D-glucosamine synthase n=1 Tax=Sulfurifustis variabilis TaxID=1675686 RepID=A0A1B4V4T8_9GAMM|nr:poly-beta-1,6-N-acetyl-D-glucosamine synthase [Sulfurifustis variabilis]BAU48530.1 N-glycosyltransferase [Sulfurifustis variabilis]